MEFIGDCSIGELKNFIEDNEEYIINIVSNIRLRYPNDILSIASSSKKDPIEKLELIMPFYTEFTNSEPYIKCALVRACESGGDPCVIDFLWNSRNKGKKYVFHSWGIYACIALRSENLKLFTHIIDTYHITDIVQTLYVIINSESNDSVHCALLFLAKYSTSKWTPDIIYDECKRTMKECIHDAISKSMVDIVKAIANLKNIKIDVMKYLYKQITTKIHIYKHGSDEMIECIKDITDNYKKDLIWKFNTRQIYDILLVRLRSFSNEHDKCIDNVFVKLPLDILRHINGYIVKFSPNKALKLMSI